MRRQTRGGAGYRSLDDRQRLGMTSCLQQLHDFQAL
jgi:hypothetical protein